MIKPRRQEIGKRLVELKSALSSLMMAKRQSGVRQEPSDEPDPDETNLVSEIEALDHKKNMLSISPMRYRSNLQLAMFYTHNISPQSDTDNRFDRILEIVESSTHLTISLVFTDQLSSQYKYHSKISTAHRVERGCPGQGSGIVTGIVKRVVPIDSVTLEIVSRPAAKLEDLVSLAQLEP